MGSTTYSAAVVTLGVITAIAPVADAGAGGSCAPDINMDGSVGALDILDLFSEWGCTSLAGPCPADINMDGIVGTDDLVLLILCWGDCPCRPLGNNEVFDQIVVVDATDPIAEGLGLVVTHVYATGENVQPGDRLAAGGDTSITITGGTFFQFGGDGTPPDSTFCGALPQICLDTFVTNQYLSDDGGAVIAMPNLSITSNTISGTWMTTPDDPANVAEPVPGTGLLGVLIAQITIEPALGPSSVGYTGTARLFTGYNAGGSAAGSEAAMAFYLTGACCMPNNACVAAMTLLDCMDQGGAYQGDGTECRPNPFDITGDDVVGINDFLALLAAWGPNPGNPADYDGDDVVGINDFLTLLMHWGPCPI